MAKKRIKPRLVIAGPGSGKTHSMVEEMLSVLPSVPPHRYVAAITFTNAAASMIRERLQRHSRVRGNIFIGTTHNFINRFVLAPCATLFGTLPEERMFAAIPI